MFRYRRLARTARTTRLLIHEQSIDVLLASSLRLLLAAPSRDAARTPSPFFAPAETADPLLDDSQRLQATSKGRGSLRRFEVFPREIHRFNTLVGRKAARDKLRAVAEFLRHYAA